MSIPGMQELAGDATRSVHWNLSPACTCAGTVEKQQHGDGWNRPVCWKDGRYAQRRLDGAVAGHVWLVAERTADEVVGVSDCRETCQMPTGPRNGICEVVVICSCRPICCVKLDTRFEMR